MAVHGIIRTGAAVFAAALMSAFIMTGCSSETPVVKNYTYSGNPAEDFTTALRAGEIEILERLLDSDPTLLELVDGEGQTPMHYAALAGQPKVIRLLAERGMDPNIRDTEGRTPLTVLEDSGFRYEDARNTLLALGGSG